jgi:hypothetical protein
MVMVQIFRYTRHNSINQAVAAFRALREETELVRFVARLTRRHERSHIFHGLLGRGEVLRAPAGRLRCASASRLRRPTSGMQKWPS